MPPLTLNFATVYDPANRRLGEEYLELYTVAPLPPPASPPKILCGGEIEVTGSVPEVLPPEVLTIPINWYQKGQTRTWSLDLWYARRQEADRVEDVRLSAYAFGADNALGQEVVANGYLQAKLSTSLIWSPLTVSTGLSLGSFWPNSKKTVDFQFNMPVGALTPVGLNMIGLKIELLRSVVYGSTAWGRAMYGKYEGKKKDVLIKLHVMQ